MTSLPRVPHVPPISPKHALMWIGCTKWPLGLNEGEFGFTPTVYEMLNFTPKVHGIDSGSTARLTGIKHKPKMNAWNPERFFVSFAHKIYIKVYPDSVLMHGIANPLNPWLSQCSMMHSQWVCTSACSSEKASPRKTKSALLSG